MNKKHEKEWVDALAVLNVSHRAIKKYEKDNFIDGKTILMDKEYGQLLDKLTLAQKDLCEISKKYFE